MSAATSRSRNGRIAGPAAVALLAWVAATTFAGTSAAHGQGWAGHGPWCANIGDGRAMECNYYSLRQCMARASGLTNSCSVNPWYVSEPAPVRRYRRNVRR